MRFNWHYIFTPVLLKGEVGKIQELLYIYPCIIKGEVGKMLRAIIYEYSGIIKGAVGRIWEWLYMYACII